MVVSLRRTYRPKDTQHSRSSALASDQLDSMADENATSADIEQRKEILLHGPAEFRNSRTDQHLRPVVRVPQAQRLAEAAEGMASYRAKEASTYANLQRLRDERVAREKSRPMAAAVSHRKRRRIEP